MKFCFKIVGRIRGYPMSSHARSEEWSVDLKRAFSYPFFFFFSMTTILQLGVHYDVLKPARLSSLNQCRPIMLLAKGFFWLLFNVNYDNCECFEEQFIVAQICLGSHN